jgi:putative FmdB family regulatory protein
MPIYSYRCETCGHQQDVLQKMSDPLLATCPACGASTYRKQVTAAGFQLKGSGWYVTDFRNPATKESSKPKSDDAATGSGGDGGAKTDAPDAAKAAPAPAPATESKAATKTESASTKASPPPAAGNG